MSMNRLEEKQLKEIQITDKLINEGFLANALIRLLFSGKVKKIMKQGAKYAKDDPELQAAFADLSYNTKKIQKFVDTFCDKYPESKKCK